MALDKPLSTVDNPALPKLQRRDAYWTQPLLVVLGLVGFGIYTAWRAFENNYYEAPAPLNYLSPFYSPLLPVHGFSPALLVLPVPLLFRATCYYYRKAYYRAFFGDPSACAVKEALPRPGYTGEREGLLVFQNAHRYAFYLAVIVLGILWWDALLAFTVKGGGGLRVGLGSVIFLANVVLLSLFTFSCNSWRHLSGGCLNCFSCSAANKKRHSIWQRVSHFNEHHALWAWLSLFSVWAVDLYVRALATGALASLGNYR